MIWIVLALAWALLAVWFIDHRRMVAELDAARRARPRGKSRAAAPRPDEPGGRHRAGAVGQSARSSGSRERIVGR